MMRLSIMLTLCLAGCSLERGEPGFTPQDGADASTTDALRADVGFGSGSGAATLTGTWLQIHEASTCVVIQEQVTHASYIVQIEQDGRTLVEHRQQCEVSLSEVLGQQVVVPDLVLPLIQFLEIDTGFVSSLGEAGTYSSSTELSLWGLELENPLTDLVPDDAADPAVVDVDEDGNPGVTFRVLGSECERYITQRTIVRYTGTFTAPNQIDGSSVTVTDSNVVGSSQALCGVDPRLVANDRESKFRMVRIDGGGESIDLDANDDGEISCDEVRPYIHDILERREPDHENCD